MTQEPIPPVNDYCWPVDTSSCADWDAETGDPAVPLYSDEVKARAVALAAMTLRMLTGYRVGGCPITVRPCRKPCSGINTWRVAPLSVGSIPGAVSSGSFTPLPVGGQWVNMPCGCTLEDCSCGAMCEVALPGPVGRVDAVTLDGAVIDPTAYRVDNHHLLVRTDGECWPTCQDLSAAPDQPDTFAVTYLNAVEVDAVGAYAAGLLACEYAKASIGKQCALPSNVTRVVRHGVALDLSTGVFPSNQTGIREVDGWVRRWNPHGLNAASTVWSPDLRRPRHSMG